MRPRPSSSNRCSAKVDPPAPQAFMTGLVERCRQHGILFIADEVQSGSVAPARCSRWSTPGSSPTSSAWPRESPAASLLASVLGASSTTLADRKPRRDLRRQRHRLRRSVGHDRSDERAGLPRQRRGPRRPTHAGIRELQQEHDVIAQVRGLGLMVGTEFHDAAPSRRSRSTASKRAT